MAGIKASIDERIPGFSTIPAAQRRRLTHAASLPDEFLEVVAVTVDISPEVGMQTGFRPSRCAT